MKALLFFIMSMLVSVAGMAQKPKFNIEADLQRLDSVVVNSANYDRQKQQNINLIKRSMGGMSPYGTLQLFQAPVRRETLIQTYLITFITSRTIDP